MFQAHCSKGHDRIDFDGDPQAFEAHMTSEHRARKLRPGGAGYWDATAPGWHNGRIEAPYAWAAPRRSPGGLERIVRDLEAGKYDTPLAPRGATVRPGEAVA